jgi:hypothetical protein
MSSRQRDAQRQQEISDEIARHAERTALNAPSPSPPRPHAPDVPPPAPVAEERPPRPSQNADWIPGYWHWDGFGYGWIGGFWRVPDSDVEAQLTQRAPSPPPAARPEAPSAPIHGAVWIPGYWLWSGQQWVWVHGTFNLPPANSIEWQPPRWLVDGRGARFVPGRWRVR